MRSFQPPLFLILLLSIPLLAIAAIASSLWLSHPWYIALALFCLGLVTVELIYLTAAFLTDLAGGPPREPRPGERRGVTIVHPGSNRIH